MTQACEEYKLDQSEGMLAAVARYSETDQFQYHLGFGISRVI
jgi:hypothetical protein